MSTKIKILLTTIAICLPSIAPTQFGKFHRLEKPSELIDNLASVGMGNWAWLVHSMLPQLHLKYEIVEKLL